MDGVATAPIFDRRCGTVDLSARFFVAIATSKAPLLTSYVMLDQMMLFLTPLWYRDVAVTAVIGRANGDPGRRIERDGLHAADLHRPVSAKT